MQLTNAVFFNTNYKTFKEIATMKTKRKRHVLVNLEGIVYCIGGKNERYEDLNTIETFDPVTEQWKMSDAKLHVSRQDHQAVAHQHFIYIFGGYIEGARSSDIICDKYSDTIEKYNLLTGQIELLDVKLRVGRCQFAVGKIDSDVYIFGGRNYHGNADEMEIFNLETGEIRQFSENIPFSDFCFTACVL